MTQRSPAVLAVIAVAFVCSGCGTFYRTEYYKFSGAVVDADTGAPIPRVAIYIAESEDDIFGPLRIYQDEVPWYVKGPAYLDTSELHFGRRAQSRYLFLMADEAGEFTTVWRHDIVKSGVLPLALLKSGRLNSIALALGAPGYSERVVTFEETSDGQEFAYRTDPVGMPYNALPAISVSRGDSGNLKPRPIEAACLRTRYPSGPVGPAGSLFEEAEKAFSEKAFGQALRLYDKALEEAPHHPLVLLMRMDALYRLECYEEVLEAAEHYVRLYPDVGFAHVVIADAAHMLGRRDLNKHHLTKAMQLDPEFRNTYLSLVNLDRGYAEVPEYWLPLAEVWTDVSTGPAPLEWRRK